MKQDVCTSPSRVSPDMKASTPGVITIDLHSIRGSPGGLNPGIHIAWGPYAHCDSFCIFAIVFAQWAVEQLFRDYLSIIVNLKPHSMCS